MKKLFFYVIISVFGFGYSQSPTDCIDAVIVCGNASVNLNVSGIGTQEIAGLGCSSQEHNSLWLRVKVTTDGTLGFTLSPNSSSITEDYDFWVFGPDVSCGNLGLPLRCSTTNPQAANQGNNQTGMNGTSTDTSEGPGPDGDSFVQWLDVLADEVYYIVIDRPIGNSAFSLEWTGSAQLGEQPQNQSNTADLHISSCDTTAPFDDRIMEINLDANTPLITGNQNNIAVSYHANENDAILNINALISPYFNSSPNETIFVRITNMLTDCFDITTFQITVHPQPDAVDTVLYQCDNDSTLDGFTQFQLDDAVAGLTNANSTSTVTFFESLSEAQSHTNPITTSLYTNILNPQILYAVVANTSGCEAIATLTLEANTTQLQSYSWPAVCDEINSEDGQNTFNLNDIAAVIEQDLPTNVTLDFYETANDAANQENELPLSYTNTTPYQQTLFVRATSDNGACYGIGEVTLTINPLPQLAEDETTFYCLNFHPQPLTLSSGIQDSNTGDYSYLWNTGETSESIQINQPGNYTVTVTNAFGCSQQRAIAVEPSNLATIENIEVLDASENNTVTINVSGEGNYLFSLFNAEGAVFPFQESPVFTQVPAGIHTVRVRDIKNDCGEVTQIISVIGFPKYFTPNNDGYNDTWNIKGTSEQFQPNSNVYVYNRFGKLLKQFSPLSGGWDGTFNGKQLPNDDYWFKVTLQDGRVFTGHFSLKR